MPRVAKSATARKFPKKTRKSKNIKLPDKPSELILMALEDLKQAVQDGCVVDMGQWHSEQDVCIGGIDQNGLVQYKNKKVCAVCLAGSVMRRGVGDKQECSVGDFPDEVQGKLESLDEFRNGYVEHGLERFFGYLIGGLPKGISDWVEITEYQDNPAKFHRDMTKLAKTLARAGY